MLTFLLYSPRALNKHLNACIPFVKALGTPASSIQSLPGILSSFSDITVDKPITDMRFTRLSLNITVDRPMFLRFLLESR